MRPGRTTSIREPPPGRRAGRSAGTRPLATRRAGRSLGNRPPATRHPAIRRPTAALVLVTALTACAGAPAPEPAADPLLGALRAEVHALRDALAERARADPLVAGLDRDSARIVVATRTRLLDELTAWAARAYLDDVRLHIRPNATVRHADRVRIGIGPLAVTAGSWDVQVEIRSIRATLRAGTPRLAMTDSTRMRVAVPVTVTDAEGDVRLVFRWNAAAVPAMLCPDFVIDETLSGTVATTAYTLDGAIRLVPGDAGIVAVPDVSRSRLTVRPEPTPASWRRARQLIEERDRSFGCGLGLDPDRLEATLRDLLRRGFRFRLPADLLPRFDLPTAVDQTVEIEGRRFRVAARPLHLRLANDAIWYAAHVRVAPDSPLRQPAPQPLRRTAPQPGRQPAPQPLRRPGRQP